MGDGEHELTLTFGFCSASVELPETADVVDPAMLDPRALWNQILAAIVFTVTILATYEDPATIVELTVNLHLR